MFIYWTELLLEEIKTHITYSEYEMQLTTCKELFGKKANLQESGLKTPSSSR